MSNDSKRICFFLENLYGGGAERSMLTTAIGFKERGYAVDLLLISASGPYRKDVPEGIHIIESGIYRYKLTLFILFFKLVRYILLNKPDAIISALTLCNVQLMLAKMVTRNNVKCLMTIRNIEDPELSKKKRTFQIYEHAVLSRMQIFFSSYADKIVTVSLGLANYVKSNYPGSNDRVVTIYNPVYSADIIAKSNEYIDGNCFDYKEMPIVITSGRLHPDKNYSTLINAIKKVHQKKLVRLIILGDGDLRNELHELINTLGLQEYVEMLGFKDNPYAYMSRSDVFVLSSNHEGFGRVLVEAMACGCPVVSTDCPSGPREILEDGKWGRLVPTGDYNSMAEAIIETIDNPIPKNLLVARAKCFSIERAVDEYERVIYE